MVFSFPSSLHIFFPDFSPCMNFFVCFFPHPHPPNYFSNGPSLISDAANKARIDRGVGNKSDTTNEFQTSGMKGNREVGIRSSITDVGN